LYSARLVVIVHHAIVAVARSTPDGEPAESACIAIIQLSAGARIFFKTNDIVVIATQFHMSLNH